MNSSDPVAWHSLFGPIVAALAAYVGAHIAAKAALSNGIRLKAVESRHLAYSTIMGNRAILTQSALSVAIAKVNIEFHRREWLRRGCPEPGFDLEEVRRWIAKETEEIRRTAEARAALYQAVGLSETNFPKTAKLYQLATAIYELPEPPTAEVVRTLNDGRSVEQCALELQAWIDTNYDSKIMALCKELRRTMGN